jgi:hypothetical protein
VISGGVTAELADAQMVALGHRSDAPGSEDMCALADLYTAVPSTWREADEAAGLPALSCPSARSAEDSLSTFEDDLSLNRTPLGEDESASLCREPPVEVLLPAELKAGGPGQ